MVKKRIHHKKHFHLTAIIIFITVVLASVLAFYIFEKRNFFKSPSFDDYKVSESFSGKAGLINYSSDNNAVNFKNQIEEQVKKGVNFAGHFVLTLWSCGQNCETGAVVDAVNGIIYDLPAQATCGIDFRKDSRLMILNSGVNCPKGLGAEKPRYFIFGG